jgi:rRNA maturation endonuclease Nob1
MRVIVLRKQDITSELPEEARQKAEEAARTALIEEIQRRLDEIEANLEGMSVEELTALFQQLGGERKLLRKGEVTIIPESIFEALEALVQAINELASKFPAIGEEEKEQLLEVVEEAKANLSALEEQLKEGTIRIEEEEDEEEEEEEEELKKQEEKEGLYSPEDIVVQVEGLVSSLKAEMASLKKTLNDVEDNIELLAIPAERDVFIEEGWFKEKVTAIRSHVLEIAELGMELARKLAELGGVEIKGPWRR